MVLVEIIALIAEICGVILSFISGNIEAAAWAFAATLWTLNSLVKGINTRDEM